MNLILASSSPRRKEILEKNGYKFKIIQSEFEEKISNLEYSCEIVQNCACNKGLDVYKRVNEDAIIISADTVVVLNGEIIGKPENKNEAFNMLKNLSNKTHFVATSICLIKTDTNKIIKNTDITYVTFRNLSDEEIMKYIESSNPYDKAGGYGYQDKNFDFMEKIEGEEDTVIGFPIKLFRKMLLFI